MTETVTAIALLPSSADKQSWNPQQAALMESLGLKGEKNVQRNGSWVKVPFEAPDSIVEAFIHQIHRTNLDPVARQIYCIERGGKWGIQISIDGFRLIAERSGEYRGQTPAQWTDGVLYTVPLREDGKVVRNAAGDPVMVEDYRWLDVWTAKEPPAAARVGVYRDGFSEPMWGVATYEGYVAKDRNGKPTGQWESNPANQSAKCAEMLALRKAFPQELSGLYGTEEMDQAGNPRGPAPAPARAAVAPVVEDAEPRDLGADVAATKTLADLTALANETQTAGLWGTLIDSPDGEKEELGKALFRRRSELTPPTIVDVPEGKSKPRQWVREARALRKSEDVRALWREAQAAGAEASVLDELLQIESSLPAPKVEATEHPEGWAPVEPVAEPGDFVEVEPGVYAEQGTPAVLAGDEDD
jgi:phage recombination protein Bet